jgi:hypothetical protein
MSRNRRGGGGRKTVQGKNVGMGRRTSACLTSVLNLGSKSPRVMGIHDVADGEKKSLPATRDERQSLPTHRRIMSLLSMAIVPEERGLFRRRFRKANRDEDGRCCEFLCKTPISVVATAFECVPLQLRSATDMFTESGIHSEFLNEFYVMDVILNRAVSVNADVKSGKEEGKPTGVDCDVVRPVLSYEPEHQGPEWDYLYRAVILFLPQCGVFYCDRERRRGDVGLPGTLVAHDMSWLRLQRNAGGSYTFGDDSFVKRFYSESRGPPVYSGPIHQQRVHYPCDNHRVTCDKVRDGANKWVLCIIE